MVSSLREGVCRRGVVDIWVVRVRMVEVRVGQVGGEVCRVWLILVRVSLALERRDSEWASMAMLYIDV